LKYARGDEPGMKIALVVPGGVDRSGEYRVIPALLALVARLSAQHTVHVFALAQEPRPASWQLAGAHVHNIGARATRRRAVRMLRSEHRAGRFDVIQSIWSGSCGLIAVIAGALLRVPCAVHVAGGELIALEDIGYGGRLTWRGRLREALVLRMATAVTAASAPMIAAVAPYRSAQRVPLGADLQVWVPRPPVRRAPGGPARLVHVASLNRVKDQGTLLRALALLLQREVEFEMDIIGEDTLGGAMQRLCRELQLEKRVRFHGFLTQEQLRPIIEAAHLMIVSSRHEAGPLAVLEAAAVGVPSVGTAVGHIAEWAPHAALAVPVGAWASLADAVGRVLADEELRLALAHEAHARAMREDADHTARCFLSLYAELIAARR
jgi:glycosyltransferase involved in cell wall biosynthesis